VASTRLCAPPTWGQRRLGGDRRGRPRPPQFPDRAGQPLFSPCFAKVPVLDPSSPRQAKDMVAQALELFGALRPSGHGATHHPGVPRPAERPLRAALASQSLARFDKDPRRWCATPAFVLSLHRELNTQDRPNRRAPEFAPQSHPRGRAPAPAPASSPLAGLRPYGDWRRSWGSGAGSIFPGNMRIPQPGLHQHGQHPV